MAYSITESPIDYHASERYAQYTGLRKGIAQTDYDAQVASQHAIYSAAIEQQLERNKASRKPSQSQKVSSQPATRNPSVVTIEQRSRSLDQGKNTKDTDLTEQRRLNSGQQKALEALTEGTRVDEQKDRNHTKEVDWNSRFVRSGHTHHHPSKSLPDNPSKSFSYGLPSNPRPDPHRPNPSEDKAEILPLRKESTPPAPQIFNEYQYAGTHQKKPSYPYSEDGFSSRKGSSDSRKGSSSSQKEERNYPVPSQPVATQVSSGSKLPTRRVKVTCDQISFTLSITPISTAKDVLTTARDRLGEGFDMKRYALVESYRQLGSERPIRHFERIWDVLDSWDSDDKDSLLIQPLHTQWDHDSMDLENAPKLLPSNMTASLYYSHRPESWHKWTFILRVDGQIVMQKYGGGEFKAVCHMRDCDIYIPTSRQMKKLAPPRKFCFAIKSQQKSTSFTDASQFVHFFSTSEKELASEWYRAVQSWRSYYLVHMKEAHQSQPTALSASTHIDVAPQRNASLARGNQRKDSTEKPLPRLEQLAISTSRNAPNPQDPQGYRSYPYDRTASTSHNRSISADREQRPPPSHIRGLSEPRETSIARTYAGEGHIVRKASAPARSGSIPVAAQSSLPSRTLPQNTFAPSEHGTLGQSYATRKQTIFPASVPDPTVPQQYKPSVDLGVGRKLSDDSNSNAYPGTTFPQPEWKFDPYTGKPITSAWSSNIHTSTVQQNGTYPLQASRTQDIYITMEPSDRKLSNEASIGYFAPVHRDVVQGYQTANDTNNSYKPALYDPQRYNHTQDQPLANIGQQQIRGLYLPSERTYDATTRTDERFF